MEFALTAGAVGDFLSIAVLIKDIIAALDDSRGSAKQYRELVQQLNTLDQTLDTIQQTLKDPRVTHSLEFISGIVLDTVANIKKCLVDFLGQISKYEPALGISAPVNKASLTGAWMNIQRKANSNFRKVQWKLNEKDINKFCAEVMGYTMALEMALGVITLRVLQRNYDSLVKEQSGAERRTANLIRRSKTSLKRSLDSVGRGIVSKLEIIHSLGTQIKTTTGQIIASLQSIAADVNSVKAIVMHLDMGPGDEHFILEDITGRKFPIHLKTITSWAVLEFILTERFKGKKGACRVQHRRYTLRESKTHREIDGSIPWDSAFLPHQKVNMSLMCNEAKSNDTNGKAASSCPFCKTLSDSVAPIGIEVEWKVYLPFFS
ncbi:hypothetical protein FCULG_00011064 [Fusarium culmorum]|uniref:Ubiquitin-like domain-containing protein n=1 Tax=Fusarium culmorum TaxID=5516 RepID=A0A2T4GZX9_FUSCU|nr:hypothetical protein FCULG_00011064 [Fusarium culmorum]